MIRTKTRSAKRKRGQALAEMAIVLPVLLLLVFGIIEMSNAWRTFQVVTNAAREGARVAILDNSTVDDVRDRIRDHLRGGGVPVPPDNAILVQCYSGSDQDDQITGNGKCTNSGDEARIRVEVAFTFNVLGRLADLVPITIASTSSMRKE